MKVRTALERLLLMPLWPFSVIKPEKLEETNICPVIKGISLLWETGVKISGRFLNYHFFMNFIKDLYD